MRVITGEYKGRRLESVRGADIRYTSDRVKESLFSILRDLIPGARFLDLYAGSGSVGIEAISRGAGFVTFVDINSACVRTISANLSRCGLLPWSPRTALLKMGASRAIEYLRKRGMEFDLIFLDPPYRMGLVEKSLKQIANCGILSSGGEAVAEHDVRENVPRQVGALMLNSQRRYGTTLLSFYTLVDDLS